MLDLTSGYFQVPLRPEDVPKSAFVCKYGQYEMLRLPFGLNSACATFQRLTELALQGLQWTTCLVYIDDVIVHAPSFNVHMHRLIEVLQRLSDAGLKLKPEKCRLLQPEVVFLGHVVSGDGVRPDPSNVDKVINWPTPETPKQVKQFVATASYYRRFVRYFAKIARPLIELTKLGKEFIWTANCQNAFTSLKVAFTSPPVMGYPKKDAGDFILDVDASGVGIGGVLAQIQDEQERVISYGSRALNKAERNYCVTEKELLAVVFFVQYYRQYLLGRHFRLRTDHQALVWLFRLREPNGKIARWLEILSAYHFTIEYRPGKNQGHCDALSRCPMPMDCTCHEVDMSEPLKCGPCNRCKRRADQMQHQGKGANEGQVEYAKASSSGPSDTRPPSGETSTAPSTHRRPQWMAVMSSQEMARLQCEDPDIRPLYIMKRDGEIITHEEAQSGSPETRHYYLIANDRVSRRLVVAPSPAAVR